MKAAIDANEAEERARNQVVDADALAGETKQNRCTNYP